MTDPGPLPSAAAVVSEAIEAAHESQLGLIEALADLLVAAGSATGAPATRVHTVRTLAEELGVSEKVVRGAITRGELAAAKRAGRWVITAGAAAAWATPEPTPTAPIARLDRPEARSPLRAAIQAVDEQAATRQAQRRAG